MDTVDSASSCSSDITSDSCQERYKGAYDGGIGNALEKDLISKTMTTHARFTFWYISLLSSVILLRLESALSEEVKVSISGKMIVIGNTIDKYRTHIVLIGKNGIGPSLQ